jgi:RNA ligase
LTAITGGVAAPRQRTITSVKLHDILDTALLTAHLDEGNIRVQVHPTLPYAIYNYTDKTAYSRLWDPVTLACRGLIIDTATQEVIARPYSKFFNVSELSDEELAPLVDQPVEVWEKADGSLGVTFELPDGSLAIATRGSFTSVQATHATAVLRERYAGWWPPAGITVLFEIVFPANRIVIDYSGLDDLILLGGVDIATGRTVAFDGLRAGWPGPAVKRYPFATLADALAAPEIPNCEGYVVRFTESDVRTKSKFSDYIRLHRLVTGVTARVVWEHAGVVDLAAAGQDSRRIAQALMLDKAEVDGILAAANGDWMAPFLEAVPEEFATWVKQTAADAAEVVDRWEWDQRTTFAELAVDASDRRAAAAQICALPKPQQGAMFALLDGKSIRALAWRQARPGHEVPFVNDTAGA